MQQLWKSRGWTAIDVESSGLDSSARVLEVGLVRYSPSGEVIERFSSLINPGEGFDWNAYMKSKAFEVNQISKDDVLGWDAHIGNDGPVPARPAAPTFAKMFNELLPASFYEQTGAWVAHNAAFDTRMIMREFSLMGVTFVFPAVFCSQILEAYLCPEVKGWKLAEVAQRRQILFEGDAHRAETDAKVCGDIFGQMVVQMPDGLHDAQRLFRHAEAAWHARWVKGGYNHNPQSQEAKPGEHHCHAYGCNVAVKPELLCCGKHWSMVPRDLQRAVWDNYRAGQCDDKNPSLGWRVAADRALLAIAKAEKQPREVLANLDRHLDRSVRRQVQDHINRHRTELLSTDPEDVQMSHYGAVRLYRDGLRDAIAFVAFSPAKVKFSAYRFGYLQGLSIESELTSEFAQKIGCDTWKAADPVVYPGMTIGYEVTDSSPDGGDETEAVEDARLQISHRASKERVRGDSSGHSRWNYPGSLRWRDDILLSRSAYGERTSLAAPRRDASPRLG